MNNVAKHNGIDIFWEFVLKEIELSESNAVLHTCIFFGKVILEDLLKLWEISIYALKMWVMFAYFHCHIATSAANIYERIDRLPEWSNILYQWRSH